MSFCGINVFRIYWKNLKIHLYCGEIPKLVGLVGKVHELATWIDFIVGHQFETYFNSY